MGTNTENTVTTKLIDNNNIIISGEVVSEAVFNHEVFGEKFYLVSLMVKRLSDTSDIIPLMVSDRLVDLSALEQGKLVSVQGQLRSYNKHEETRNRLILSVFARNIEFVEEDESADKCNNIVLDGYVCKQPVYRKTPLGREICDILVAVNRPYGKSDYIPCICWGRNARFAEGFNVGDRIKVNGRLQSRTYTKKIDENTTEEKTAYEVSVSKIEIVEETEN